MNEIRPKGSSHGSNTMMSEEGSARAATVSVHHEQCSQGSGVLEDLTDLKVSVHASR